VLETIKKKTPWIQKKKKKPWSNAVGGKKSNAGALFFYPFIFCFFERKNYHRPHIRTMDKTTDARKSEPTQLNVQSYRDLYDPAQLDDEGALRPGETDLLKLASLGVLVYRLDASDWMILSSLILSVQEHGFHFRTTVADRDLQCFILFRRRKDEGAVGGTVRVARLLALVPVYPGTVYTEISSDAVVKHLTERIGFDSAEPPRIHNLESPLDEREDAFAAFVADFLGVA